MLAFTFFPEFYQIGFSGDSVEVVDGAAMAKDDKFSGYVGSNSGCRLIECIVLEIVSRAL